MVRKFALLVTFAFAASSVTADEKGSGKLGKLDKSKMFEKLDTNSDNKLSKDEMKKGFETLKEKLADKGGKAGKIAEKVADKLDGEKLFEKLDADKDGFVSKDEFEKADLLGQLRGKKDDAESKPDAEKKPESEKKPG